MKKNIVLIASLLTLISSDMNAQETINLYNGAIPNSKPFTGYKERTTVGNDGRRYISNVSNPTLTVYIPQKSNGTSVIILPGGGYCMLAIDHEGIELAKRFNEYGITAFILKYRLPSDSIMVYKTNGPLQDAQRAIQLVRQQAEKFMIDRNRIGIVGSSAGGHLAATAGTLFNFKVIDNPSNTSLRPDFMILLYPVISFKALAVTSSAKTLLGDSLSEKVIKTFSPDLQVTPATPPVFFVHAGDDAVVSPNHSIVFYQALLEKKIPAELHIYEKGGHGFGLHNRTTKDDWFLRLVNWMQSEKFIPASN